MSNLPLHDAIHSLNCSAGMYREDRLEDQTLAEAIQFLTAAAELHGPNSVISIIGSSDGYPGYVHIRPEAEVRRREREELIRHLESSELDVLKYQQSIRRLRDEIQQTASKREKTTLNRRLAGEQRRLEASQDRLAEARASLEKLEK